MIATVDWLDLALIQLFFTLDTCSEHSDCGGGDESSFQPAFNVTPTRHQPVFVGDNSDQLSIKVMVSITISYESIYALMKSLP